MDILDDMGVNKLLANVFLNVNYSFKSYKDFHQFQSSKSILNLGICFLIEWFLLFQSELFLYKILCLYLDIYVNKLFRCYWSPLA